MGLMDKLRKGVAEVAEEAEKAARIGRLKTEIAGLNEERKKISQQVGERVLEVYESGGRTDPDFSAEWEQVQSLLAEIAQRQVEIEATRSEDQASDTA